MDVSAGSFVRVGVAMSRAVSCPRCRSRGPIDVYRPVIEVRELTGADGKPGGDPWRFADHGNGRTWMRCDECGHTWTTKRTDIDP